MINPGASVPSLKIQGHPHTQANMCIGPCSLQALSFSKPSRLLLSTPSPIPRPALQGVLAVTDMLICPQNQEHKGYQ